MWEALLSGRETLDAVQSAPGAVAFRVTAHGEHQMSDVRELIAEEADFRIQRLSRNEKRLLTILRCELLHGPGWFQFGQWVEVPDPDSPFRRVQYSTLVDKLRDRLAWVFEDTQEMCFYVYETSVDEGEGVESHEYETVQGSGEAIARIVLGKAAYEALK